MECNYTKDLKEFTTIERRAMTHQIDYLGKKRSDLWAVEK